MTTDTPQAKKPRRGLIWWGAGLMVLGVLLGVAGGALFVRSAGASLIETFTTPVRVTPVDVTLELDEGTYVIYEATSQGHSAGPITTTEGGGVTIAPDDVTVLNGAGEELTIEGQRYDETVDRGDVTFTGAARFTVDDAGPHRIQVDGAGQQVLVAPGLVGSFGRAVAWMGIIGVGALLGIVGLLLLIIGLVRGSKSSTAKGAPAAPGAQVVPVPAVSAPSAPTIQPGWYDDPQGLARLRWWDGQQWTDHVS